MFFVSAETVPSSWSRLTSGVAVRRFRSIARRYTLSIIIGISTILSRAYPSGLSALVRRCRTHGPLPQHRHTSRPHTTVTRHIPDAEQEASRSIGTTKTLNHAHLLDVRSTDGFAVRRVIYRVKHDKTISTLFTWPSHTTREL